MEYIEEWACFSERTKLSNGQYAQILFYKDLSDSYRIDYSVCFAIASKKKELNRYLSGEYSPIQFNSTGKCGLEGLVWASQKLEYFERFLEERKNKNSNRIIRIIVMGEDQRRSRIYRRVLSKRDYKPAVIDKTQCMVKEI